MSISGNPLKHPYRTAARTEEGTLDRYPSRAILKNRKFGGIWGGGVTKYVLCLLLLPPDSESEESGK